MRPLGLVADARQVLGELGIPAQKVHLEPFYVDEPPPELIRHAPVIADDISDVAPASSTGATTAPMPKGHSILDSAAPIRADLPLACRGGICGTCRAHLTNGVDMRRNYALDDDEIQRGFVLTCQSYPVSDAVTVDFDA